MRKDFQDLFLVVYSVMAISLRLAAVFKFRICLETKLPLLVLKNLKKSSHNYKPLVLSQVSQRPQSTQFQNKYPTSVILLFRPMSLEDRNRRVIMSPTAVQTRILALIRPLMMMSLKNAQIKDLTRDQTRDLPTKAQINLLRVAQIRAVLMRKGRKTDLVSLPKKMNPREKKADLTVRRKNPASAHRQRRPQISQKDAHLKNQSHLRSPINLRKILTALNSIPMLSSKGYLAANNQRKHGNLNVITKRGLREVAVQAIRIKDVEAAVDMARIILPLDQSTLIVLTATLIILARKATAKRAS